MPVRRRCHPSPVRLISSSYPRPLVGVCLRGANHVPGRTQEVATPCWKLPAPLASAAYAESCCCLVQRYPLGHLFPRAPRHLRSSVYHHHQRSNSISSTISTSPRAPHTSSTRRQNRPRPTLEQWLAVPVLTLATLYTPNPRWLSGLPPPKNRNAARGGCTRPVTPYIPQIELEKGPARPFTSKVSSQTLFERRQIPYRARLLDAHDPSAYLGKAGRDTVIVDIASLLKSTDSNESPASPSQHTSAAPVPPTTAATAPRAGPPPSSFPLGPAVSSPRLGGRGGPPSLGAYGFPSLGPNLAHSSGSGSASRPGSGNSGKRSMPPHTSESPAKKQSKWSPEEDALIIELRGSGMKWDDISKRLPGRSSISCRLHYQNYLERRSEWDEERKNKLARLYERFVLLHVHATRPVRRFC